MEKVSRDEWKFVGQDRRMSIRECLQIQGFPKDFYLDFQTVGDAYTAIGNAVPPPLAEHIAQLIKEALTNV
jgi:site-specific DNA-cytosine methylase